MSKRVGRGWLAGVLVIAGCAAGTPAELIAGDTIPEPPFTEIIGGGWSEGGEVSRGFARRVGSQCDMTTATAIADRHGFGQYIVVRSAAWASTTATVDVLVVSYDEDRAAPVIECQLGGMAAMVGSAGMRPLLERRSGDGTAPAGAFGLAKVTAWDGEQFSIFGNSPDPGVRVPYRRVEREDCWGATPGQPTYNKLYRRSGCPGPDDENLLAVTGAYSHAAVIDVNLGPSTSGDAPGEPPYAAAIFLHRHAFDGAGRPKPTRGCVSLSLDDLVATLNLLDPTLQPRFFIGTTTWLRSHGAVR